MKNKGTKYFLLGLFLFLLWCPFLQDRLHVFKGGELVGSFDKAEDTVFDFKYWFKGEYAPKKEKFINSTFGFRADLVRLYNQINYSVFKEYDHSNIVLGKDNYLYEKMYVSSYYGKDFIGEDNVKRKVAALKLLQDTLKEHGIFLFTVFAPGKGSFYPEYLPQSTDKPGTTNYECFLKEYKNAGLNFVDLRSYFLSMKDTSSVCLFPRCGVHWSYYGEVLAFDSILKYLQNNTGRTIPQVKIEAVHKTTQPRFRDYDAGAALNLISKLSTDTLTYPDISYTNNYRWQWSFMNVGDSYYWMMYSFMAPQVFKGSSYWYYFDKLWTFEAPILEHKDALPNLKQIVLKQHIICLLHTDATLNDIGCGFVEKTNEEFARH